MPTTIFDSNYLTALGTLSNGDLTVTSTSSSTSTLAGAVATTFRTSGQWYYEVTLDSGTYWNVGMFDIVTMEANPTLRDNRIGGMSNAYGYQSTGFIFSDNSLELSGLDTVAAGDILGVAVHLDAGTVDFYKNNVLLGTSTVSVADQGLTYLAMVSTGNFSAATANFGASAFTFTPPAGFLAWDTADPLPNALDTTNSRAGTLSNGNLTLTHDINTTARSTVGSLGRGAGKYQIEYTLDADATGTFLMGLASEEVTTTSIAWNTATSSAYRSAAATAVIGGSTVFPPNAVAGDVMTIQADLDTDSIEIFRNGISEHTGTLAGRLRDMYPIIAASSTLGGSCTINYGATPMTTTLPAGYMSWDGTQEGPSTWDPNRSGTGVVLSNADLTATLTSGTFKGTGSITKKASGKLYAEVTVDSAAGEIRIGIGPTAFDEESIMGNTIEYYYRSGGSIEGPSGSTSGATYTVGDVIGLVVDLDGLTLQFTKNGVDQGAVRTINISQEYYVRASFHASSSAVTANFGATAFGFSAPAGYNAWDGTILGPLALTMVPDVVKIGALTNVAFTGEVLSAVTTVKFDDGINPIVSVTANNVTATSLDCDVTLIQGVYSVTLNDGTDDFLQDEIMTAPLSVDGTIIGADNTQTRVVRLFRWDTGAFLNEQVVDLNLGQDYLVGSNGFTGEVFVVTHKQSETGPFLPIATAGPVVPD